MDNILILGANSDIAQAIGVLYANKGYSVTLASRNLDALLKVKSDIQIRHNAVVEALAFDATDFGSHQAFYDSLHVKPKIVVCAFGYLGEQEMAQRDWDQCKQIIDVNFTGAVSILNIVANDMEKRGEGAIVGISSVAGDRGRQSNYLYGASKAAFTSYLSGLRNRLFKSNVHVVTLKPGFVKTKMIDGITTPAPLTAKPEEVARAVFKSVNKKKNVTYTKGMWRFIMMGITNIPETVFKKMSL